MSFNSWLYGYANPLNLIDPTGHKPISPEYYPPYYCPGCDLNWDKTGCGDLDLLLGEHTQSVYDYLVEVGVFSFPDFSSEFDYKYRYENLKTRYQEIRHKFFLESGWVQIEKNGKLRDTVVMALILQEFRNYSLDNLIYQEGVEAVSNQYYYLGYKHGCVGLCDNVMEQAKWLQDIEIFYSSRVTTLKMLLGWERNLGWAKRAKQPDFKNGAERRTWTWGNYEEGSELADDIFKGTHQYYLFADPRYRFVLMDLRQNIACGPICKGWIEK